MRARGAAGGTQIWEPSSVSRGGGGGGGGGDVLAASDGTASLGLCSGGETDSSAPQPPPPPDQHARTRRRRRRRGSLPFHLLPLAWSLLLLFCGQCGHQVLADASTRGQHPRPLFSFAFATAKRPDQARHRAATDHALSRPGLRRAGDGTAPLPTAGTSVPLDPARSLDRAYGGLLPSVAGGPKQPKRSGTGSLRRWLATVVTATRRPWLRRGGALLASPSTEAVATSNFTGRAAAAAAEGGGGGGEEGAPRAAADTPPGEGRSPARGEASALDGATTAATAAPAPPPPSATSVHLLLTDPILAVDPAHAGPAPADDGDDDDDGDGRNRTAKAVTVHTYRDPASNETWTALNTAPVKFRAYLQYRGVLSPSGGGGSNRNDTAGWTTAVVTTQQHVLEATAAAPGQEDAARAARRRETEARRAEWRALWKQGRLLTDRTELLAVYPSDAQPPPPLHQNYDSATLQHQPSSAGSPSPAVRKRGGFADLLHLYTDRLLAVLSDEQEEAMHAEQHSLAPSEREATLTATGLIGWLEAQYGREETDALRYERFRTLDEGEQLVKLKHFLEWFRSQFPYYYDRCGSCGASIKEDTATAAAARPAADAAKHRDDQIAAAADVTDEADAEKEEKEHQTFVGYIYPNRDELEGKASRTELYQCHACGAYTRFPRYNSAAHVTAHRRGRCGEYSMLLYRLLRALHHECRWVVDWADHVWAEILLPTATPRWVHLDPCEAAVDENYIYQDWGKKQIFILGFRLPPISRHGAPANATNATMIEDVTQSYTRESWSDICNRRDESEAQVKSSITKAEHELQKKLRLHLDEQPTRS